MSSFRSKNFCPSLAHVPEPGVRHTGSAHVQTLRARGSIFPPTTTRIGFVPQLAGTAPASTRKSAQSCINETVRRGLDLSGKPNANPHKSHEVFQNWLRSAAPGEGQYRDPAIRSSSKNWVRSAGTGTTAPNYPRACACIRCPIVLLPHNICHPTCITILVGEFLYKINGLSNERYEF